MTLGQESWSGKRIPGAARFRSFAVQSPVRGELLEKTEVRGQAHGEGNRGLICFSIAPARLHLL